MQLKIVTYIWFTNFHLGVLYGNVGWMWDNILISVWAFIWCNHMKIGDEWVVASNYAYMIFWAVKVNQSTKE